MKKYIAVVESIQLDKGSISKVFRSSCIIEASTVTDAMRKAKEKELPIHFEGHNMKPTMNSFQPFSPKSFNGGYFVVELNEIKDSERKEERSKKEFNCQLIEGNGVTIKAYDIEDAIKKLDMFCTSSNKYNLKDFKCIKQDLKPQ